jgi:flagellar hook protein FlgE
VAVEADGIVIARYTNGQSKAAGQIELASFRNPQGLQSLPDNAWGRTYASGDPIFGVAGDANFGVLQASALEESNVDLTGELVSMITAQRVYQANAQSIKTQDQVLQTLVNLR